MTATMTTYTVVDKAGRILRSGMCPVKMLDIQARPGQVVVPGKFSDKTHYMPNIKGKVMVERPDMPVVLDKNTVIANAVDIVNITGIPEGAEVEFRGADAVSKERPDTPNTTIAVDTPDTYTLRISRFPYKDFETTITGV